MSSDLTLRDWPPYKCIHFNLALTINQQIPIFSRLRRAGRAVSTFSAREIFESLTESEVHD